MNIGGENIVVFIIFSKGKFRIFVLQKDKYSVINIRRYLESDDPRLGEEDLIQILSEFLCEKNPNVERFLKKSSIEFTKKNQSITYIVLSFFVVIHCIKTCKYT